MNLSEILLKLETAVLERNEEQTISSIEAFKQDIIASGEGNTGFVLSF